MIFNVPNVITYVRILFIPVLVLLMAFVDPNRDMGYNILKCQVATLIFAIAGISDLIDGYWARKYGAVSIMGKFIDPMADKLIHLTAMVMLIPLGRMPAWLVIIFMCREILITGLRAVAAGEGLIITAAAWGKRKTAWLNFGLGGLIYHYPIFAGSAVEFSPKAVGWVCVVVALLYSLASGAVYLKDFFKVVGRR